MTRAKSTLVIADDAGLFAKQEKSFAALLDILDGPRAKAFRGLPEKLPVFARSEARSEDCRGVVPRQRDEAGQCCELRLGKPRIGKVPEVRP
jgi:hypothetical protein